MPKFFASVQKVDTDLPEDTKRELKIKLLETIRDRYPSAYVSEGRLADELHLGHKNQVRALIDELIEEDRLAKVASNAYGDTQYRLVLQPRPFQPSQPSPVTPVTQAPRATRAPLPTPMTDQVIEYLNQYPGANAEQIGAALFAHTLDAAASARSTLGRAVRKGLVTRRALDGYVRYFAGNYRVPTETTQPQQGKQHAQRVRCKLCGATFRDKKSRGGHLRWHTMTQRGQRYQTTTAAAPTAPAAPTQAAPAAPAATSDIEILAARYVWETNRNDLREFFVWMKDKV